MAISSGRPFRRWFHALAATSAASSTLSKPIAAMILDAAPVFFWSASNVSKSRFTACALPILMSFASGVSADADAPDQVEPELSVCRCAAIGG